VSAPQGPPPWRYMKEDDPLHEKIYDKFILDGKYLKSPRIIPESGPSLVIVCHGGKVEQNYIVVGAVIATRNAGILGEIPSGLEARIDGKKKSLLATGVSTDGLAFYFTRLDLHDVLKGHQAIIGVSEYLGAQVVMQFDVPDPAAVLSGCAKDKMLHPKKWYR